MNMLLLKFLLNLLIRKSNHWSLTVTHHHTLFVIVKAYFIDHRRRKHANMIICWALHRITIWVLVRHHSSLILIHINWLTDIVVVHWLSLILHRYGIVRVIMIWSHASSSLWLMMIILVMLEVRIIITIWRRCFKSRMMMVTVLLVIFLLILLDIYILTYLSLGY
jgi:hypothetical protein